jgi:hypothetical protein
MAEVAEKVANLAIQATKGLNRNTLKMFDRIFSRLYLGNDGIGETLGSAFDLYGLHIRGTIGFSYKGQAGFKEKFKEPNDEGVIEDNSDQTHHFAAFLSAGINNQQLAADLHRLTDLGNPPDIALGNAAFKLGFWLRYDPKRLSRIKEEILKRICDTTNK